MAIASQSAMPQPAATARPPAAAAMRARLLVPMQEPRVGWTVVRIVGLVLATAVSVGLAGAVALMVLTGALAQTTR